MNIESIETVAVGGWSKTGMSLAKLLLTLGKKVKVTEERERGCFSPALIDVFARKGVCFEFGGHSLRFLRDAGLLIVSPGIDLQRSALSAHARELCIPAVGEIEFCFWLTRARCVGITGTNGKSTTTFLTYLVLKEKRKRVFLGGNIGIPFSSFVRRTRKNDLIVLELSSFQLETILEFHPFVAALLNIEPDHLDRYPGYAEYKAAKFNIFRNQRPDEWAVVNERFLPEVRQTLRARCVPFSGGENENVDCVTRIAGLFQIPRETVTAVGAGFHGLPHRLQTVKKIQGISFINDSKATNPASTLWALQRVKKKGKRILLIAGGKDKGVSYECLRDKFSGVKQLFLIGESAPKIHKAFRDRCPAEICPSLEEAVKEAYRNAQRGDVVLLSPMCASFDMFRNYTERGSRFTAAVNKLSS
ncbi:MAG: hypothetical protein GF333_05650 [Candidatus Omnitrophica bacterium]|nr:hypothetical protein [Candidatus Omnitrophota bacterium]